MKTKTIFTMRSKIFSIGLVAVIFSLLTQCTSVPEWDKLNKSLIQEYGLTVRKISGLPKTGIKSNLEAGKVASINNLPTTALYPGVSAKLYWGQGKMAGIIQLAPNASIPEEVLSVDRFVFVLEGSIKQLINGSMVSMISKPREEQDGIHSGTPRVDFVYLEKGSKNAVVAGEAGAKIVEVYSPIRLDYLQKAGAKNIPSANIDVTEVLQPNIVPNRVYDLYDLQLTGLVAGANSRLITGKNVQVSFIAMDPGAVFEQHIHPEEQLMLVLRGGCDEILLDGTQKMNVNDVVYIPGNMVHGAYVNEFGCDAIDIFWPARADYSEKEKARNAAYRAIIPESAKLELVIDGATTRPGLIFSEGPKWMNGKIYMSSMYFDQDFNADPRRSTTVEIDPVTRNYRNIQQGMQTNGLYPYKNGNLIVCDMMGHRVIEMTTNGRVLRVLADKYNGKFIDGPNDIITDTKGGFYFTDPQFTMEAEKFQPGRNVYYVSAAGEVKSLFAPNEFAMPNGILLSPDGKTLYVNNCYDDESWFPVVSEKKNTIWAYDVNDDGTVRNGRKFTDVFLVDNVLDRKARSSGSDGMAIDKMGNIYNATYYGVQIYNPKGEFVGMINLPSFPVSLCFGDNDMKTLYIVSYKNVYKIRTNMEGYVNYL